MSGPSQLQGLFVSQLEAQHASKLSPIVASRSMQQLLMKAFGFARWTPPQAG
ncbi:hypothetical protein DVH05_027853 [Phytophthora capsici]|nr:hypothetical protein DVH05_027853 [Phytophthora capsici]